MGIPVFFFFQVTLQHLSVKKDKAKRLNYFYFNCRRLRRGESLKHFHDLIWCKEQFYIVLLHLSFVFILDVFFFFFFTFSDNWEIIIVPVNLFTYVYIILHGKWGQDW